MIHSHPLTKPVACPGTMPCGHPAYVYDRERGCRAIVRFGSPQSYAEKMSILTCDAKYTLVMQWGTRCPVRYVPEAETS